MKIIDIIEKKKTGNALSEQEIKFFIEGVTKGTIEDYQITALLMAIYFTGMNIEETTYLTKYMAQSGEILDLSDISTNIVDKHSTGGVGDKITLLFLPLMAASGVYTAKLSGRGLAHTGGTIDKLEAIPNFNANLSVDEFKKILKINHTAISGQTPSLTPADGKLYALRDVTSTVDIIPLMASSIVSKKIASGANHIVLDVKYGHGAFLKTKEEALKLSEIMVEIGKRLNRNICAVISNMNVPLGRAIGNSIEIIEVIEFLKGNIEDDLKEITFAICQKALELAGKKVNEEFFEELILSGKALKKFKDIIEAQNGNSAIIDNYALLPSSSIKYEVKSLESGFVSDIDALKIAKVCKTLGAGREKKGDKIDYSAGIYLTKKPAQKVDKGETIAIIHTNNQNTLYEAEKHILSAFKISDLQPQKTNIVYKIIS